VSTLSRLRNALDIDIPTERALVPYQPPALPALVGADGSTLPEIAPPPPPPPARPAHLGEADMKMATTLRSLADAAENGQLAALVLASVVLHRDSEAAPPAAFTAVVDNPRHRLHLVGSIEALKGTIIATEVNERMAQQARRMPE
jgi:hypothetical protein